MWEFITGALLTPQETLRTAADKKNWKEGLLVVIFVGLINGAANTVTSGPLAEMLKSSSTTSGLELFAEMSKLVQNPAFAISVAIFSLLNSWLVISLISFGLRKLFKGAGNFPGVLAALAFATSPYLFCSPIQALSSMLGDTGMAFASMISIIVTIWVLVLEVVAIRQSLSLTNKTALATFLIAGFCYCLWYVVCLLMIGTVGTALAAISGSIH